MPVAKTKKTPAKKKQTIKKVETNVVRTTFRVDYPDTTSILIMFSNMSIDDLTNEYSEARLKDDILKISVGLNKNEGEANYYNQIDHFASMLIPAKYIQSIRGYEHEG